jgi:chemotaxis family two-component system response regulator Rcp1
MSEIKPIEILLVEDNMGDIDLTKEALDESKLKNKLEIVQDGEAAMQFLYKQGKYADATTPDLILLDLNLPKKDGREVLAEIKAHPALRRIPVVVLTTSEAEEDILKVYDNYANCYIKKPVDFNKFVEVVKKIEDFWLTIVKLPPVDG